MVASLGLERKNPLPVGRYWVFRLGPEQIRDFDKWLDVHRRMKVLRVVASELDQEADPVTAFVVFEVTRDNAVVWQGPGLPDRSPPHVTSAQDVVQAPNVKSGAERLQDAADEAGKALTRGLENVPLLLFAAGVLYLMTRSKRRDDEREYA